MIQYDPEAHRQFCRDHDVGDWFHATPDERPRDVWMNAMLRDNPHIIPDGARVLDVGGAFGAVTAHMQTVRPLSSVIIQDADAQRLLLAEKYAAAMGVPAPAVIHAPAPALAIPDVSVDVVLCLGCQYYVPLRPLLAEIARVLRIGGTAIVTITDSESMTCEVAKQFRHHSAGWFIRYAAGEVGLDIVTMSIADIQCDHREYGVVFRKPRPTIAELHNHYIS